MTDIDELRRLLERLDEVDPVPWVVLENGKIGTPDTPANTDTNREDEVNELRKQFTVAMRNSAGQLLDAADEVTHLRSRVAELENPEVTREAPCPICRRKTWRFAIDDALGLFEPYQGDALERAVTEIRRLRELQQKASELPGLTATLDELRSKLAEAREVVRPFAGKSAYFAAKSEDIRRAAEWLRRQEE